MKKRVLAFGLLGIAFIGVQASTPQTSYAQFEAPEIINLPIPPVKDCQVIVDYGTLMLFGVRTGPSTNIDLLVFRQDDVNEPVIAAVRNIPLQPVDNTRRVYALAEGRLSSDQLLQIQHNTSEIRLTVDGVTQRSCSLQYIPGNHSVDEVYDYQALGSCPDCAMLSACYCLGMVYGTVVEGAFCGEVRNVYEEWNAEPTSCDGTYWFDEF